MSLCFVVVVVLLHVCGRAFSFEPIADLPPLLTFQNGTAIKTLEQWNERRHEIKQIMMDYFIGSFPTSVPAIKSALVKRQIEARGAIDHREVELVFDTINNASFNVEVMIPDGPGPFPVFMTQYQHRRWASIALSRGYMCCLYPGSDGHDSSDVFNAAYPEATWTTISRRGWLGSRALDYVLTLPQANRDQVCITGHSRNGKQSLIATAFDDRIKAVVSSSSGATGSCPYRFAGRKVFSEAPSDFYDHWFLESLRKYNGRQNELPMDVHAWTGLISPRPLLFSSAYNELDDTFAVEMNYNAGKPVYELYKRTENMRMLYRWGNHHGSENFHKYVDWFDLAFNRGLVRQHDFPDTLIHNFNWTQWSEHQTEKKPPNTASMTETIQWFLGKEPPMAISPGGEYISEKSYPYITELFTHDQYQPENVTRLPLNFGEYIWATLMYPTNAEGPLPVVIWLHPFNHFFGYTPMYGVDDAGPVYFYLASKGFAVLAFDQVGCGQRLTNERATEFYKRYPEWSMMGKAVRDAISAVDFITKGDHQFPDGGNDPVVTPVFDENKIFLFGYGFGGLVAQYTAALDKRVSGIAVFSAIAPLRTDTYLRTGGIQKLWKWNPVMPRLGFFNGTKQKDLPFDYDDVLALVAPRPTLVVSPLHDYEANWNDVNSCMNVARKAWAKHGAEEKFTHLSPNDYARLQAEQFKIFTDWYSSL